MRQVTLFATAASFAVGSTCAQPAASAQESTSHLFPLSGSDALSCHLVEFENFGGATALSSEPTADESSMDRSNGSTGQGLFHNLKALLHNMSAEAGAGFNAPIGDDIPYITWGANFTLGGGFHASKRYTVLAEYQFIGDKLPGALIAEAGTQGGYAHIWSLTLDPVIDLFPERANSVYVTGGGGFYRKVTSFTDPGEYQSEVVSHFSSNQGGVSFGMGLTHRLRWEDSMQFFAETRYLFLKTPPITQSNGLGTTELLPVTIGFRW
jgi:hypothetical protein